MISSGGPPLAGKQALVDAMTRAFQTTEFDESWAPEETVISGDLAYQRGTFVVVAKPKAGGAESRITGNSCASTARSTAPGSWCATRSTRSSRATVSERGLVARLELLAHERHDGRAAFVLRRGGPRRRT